MHPHAIAWGAANRGGHFKWGVYVLFSCPQDLWALWPPYSIKTPRTPNLARQFFLGFQSKGPRFVQHVYPKTTISGQMYSSWRICLTSVLPSTLHKSQLFDLHSARSSLLWCSGSPNGCMSKSQQPVTKGNTLHKCYLLLSYFLVLLSSQNATLCTMLRFVSDILGPTTTPAPPLAKHALVAFWLAGGHNGQNISGNCFDPKKID